MLEDDGQQPPVDSSSVSAAPIEKVSSSKLSVHTHGARLTHTSASGCGMVFWERTRAGERTRPASATRATNGAAAAGGEGPSASAESIDDVAPASCSPTWALCAQLCTNAEMNRCRVFNSARPPSSSVRRLPRPREPMDGRRADLRKARLYTKREMCRGPRESRAATRQLYSRIHK